MYVRVLVYVYLSIAMCVQVPPNGALECRVDGAARTAVVTITAPVMMTDESGMMTLTYEANVIGMTRGGPTPFNLTSAAEDVGFDEVFVCDDTNDVSLYIDSFGKAVCVSPMRSSLPADALDDVTLPLDLSVAHPDLSAGFDVAAPDGTCFASEGADCAPGYNLFPIDTSNPSSVFVCIPQ